MLVLVLVLVLVPMVMVMVMTAHRHIGLAVTKRRGLHQLAHRILVERNMPCQEAGQSCQNQ